MDKGKKRERAANWTEEEKDTLLDNVSLFISEIENKKTDGRATERKESAWKIVFQEFSIIHGNVRTEKQLKEMWRRLKDIAKKEVSNFNKEVKKTGGGPPPRDLSEFSSRMMNLIPNEFKQYENPFDDDSQSQDRNKYQMSTNTVVTENITEKHQGVNLQDDEEIVDEAGYSMIPDEIHVEDEEAVSHTYIPKRKSSTASSRPISISKSKKTRYNDIEDDIMKLTTEEHNMKLQFMQEEHEAKMKLINMQTRVAESMLKKFKTNPPLAIEANQTRCQDECDEFSYLEFSNNNE